MDKILVAPSTDPAKSLENIIHYAHDISESADLLHCDIMSTNFVGVNTFSYAVLKKIDEITMLPLDVHLMVNKPTLLLGAFIDSGANILTLHFEAYTNKTNLVKDLKYIRSRKVLSGLSIKPETKIEEIVPYLSFCDLVLIMSVKPGKSGQNFLNETYEKIRQLKYIKDEYKLNIKIEVDGGINPEIAQELKKLGANIIVSGSYVYNSEDKKTAIDSLR